MKPVLVPSFGCDADFARALADAAPNADLVVVRDLYELPGLALERFGALLISMHCDQRFLASRAEQIAAFLAHGGTVVANGHFAYPFLPEMTGFRAIAGYRLDDIMLLRVADHPVWDGVATEDMTFRRGVAGFYARVWHPAPEAATVIHGLGTADRPVDFVYPVGRGRVLFHGGNDLWQFGGESSTARIVPQLMRWLDRQEAVQ